MLTTDVAIVGAGSIGTFTAFHLSRAGKSVIVIDRGFAGGQSSGTSPGSLRLQGHAEPELPLAMRSQALWEKVEDEIGESVEFEQKGHFFIALNQQHLDRLAQMAPIEATHGNVCEYLSIAETNRRWPFLTRPHLGGSFNPKSATVNSRLVSPALARAGMRNGVRIFEQEEVLDIAKRGDTFQIRTDRRRIESTFLINAAGMWARPIAQMFGEDAPLFSAGPPQIVTEPVERFMDAVIHSVDGRIIFRQTPRGNIVIAGHPRSPVDDVNRRSRVPPDKMLRNIRRLIDVAPCTLPLSVIRYWTGIEGYLPDLLPVLNKSATTPGLIHSFGWSGHGLQCAPAAAEAVTELVLHDRATIDLSPYRIERFHNKVEMDAEKLKDEFEDEVLQEPRS